jgi:uncharacterized membrane protein YraQ (UPF0718 family)
VASFIFADLLIIPILIIYKKYYGPKMTVFLAVTFYVAMVVAGYVVEILFGALGLVPTERNARVEDAHLSWNYTTFLNIAFLLLTAVLVVRFLRTGGREMLATMGGSPDDMADHDRGQHEHHIDPHKGAGGHAGHSVDDAEQRQGPAE